MSYNPARAPVYKGKIAVEEAITLPELTGKIAGAPSYSVGGLGEKLGKALADIHGRIEEMDKFGIDHSVLSFTSPGAQGEVDKEKAEALARRANDYLAGEVAKNPKRFSAFASVSMHDPVSWIRSETRRIRCLRRPRFPLIINDCICDKSQAAAEATRAIKELGMCGVIINDFQSVNDANGVKFYDQPEYDVFWKTMADLDAVVYIHPRPVTPEIEEKYWSGRKWLNGAALSFTWGVATHALGLCVNGIFDRFPNAKVMIGHGGETIPYNIWRTNHRLELFARLRGMPMKKSLRYYLAKNIFITTSGFYSDPGMVTAMLEIGADNILFAVDQPYEDTEPATNWFDALQINYNDKHKIARGNAIRLLKLNLPADVED